MAAPNISGVGVVLNKKKNKKSRFVIVGSDFAADAQVSIRDTNFDWDITVKKSQPTYLVVEAKLAHSKSSVPKDTEEIDVTVTNPTAGESATLEDVPAAYVDEID